MKHASLALLAACLGCEASTTGPPPASAPALSIALHLEGAPPGLATAYLRLDPVGSAAAPIEQTRSLVGGAATFMVWGIAPGEWLVLLAGRDPRGATLLCGRALTTVVAGATADVSVRLEPASSCDPGEIDCGDGRDEDGDGAADCADDDCLGARCDDGNLCTLDDACTADGACGGAPNPCDDGVACTDDGCDALTGCLNTPIDGRCDDGVACTAGLCERVTGCRFVPQDDVCLDQDACTADRCDPLQGCLNEPIPGCCTLDADCPAGQRCVAGACEQAPCEPDCAGRMCGPDPRCGESCGACDDRDACTWDSCDDAGQCSSTLLEVAEWTGTAEGSLTVTHPAPFVGLVLPLQNAELLLLVHCRADRTVSGTLIGEAAVPGFGVGTVVLEVAGDYDADGEDVPGVHALQTTLVGFVDAPIWGRLPTTGTLDGDLTPERGDRIGGSWTGQTAPEAAAGASGDGSWTADLSCFPGSLDCSGEWFCADDVDNDGDGGVDCRDVECVPVCGPQCEVGADCDDGVACTIDICAGGVCAWDDRPCQCEGDGDCEDGIACTVDTCEARTCVRDDVSCECAVDADCPGDERCVRRACEEGPVGDGPYRPCGADAPCDPFAACLTVGMVPTGVCAPFCEGLGDCPDWPGGQPSCNLPIPGHEDQLVCLLGCPVIGVQGICPDGLVCGQGPAPGEGVCLAPPPQ